MRGLVRLLPMTLGFLMSCEADTRGLDESEPLAEPADSGVPIDAGTIDSGVIFQADAGGADSGIEIASELIFRFTYLSDVGGAGVFVQEYGFTGQGWVTIYDSAGNALETQYDCSACSCELCGSCFLCDDGPPRAGYVMGGNPIEWKWDVRVRPFELCSNTRAGATSCQRNDPLPFGQYTARFCYGYQSVPGPGGGSVVDRPVCADVPFEWPRADPLIAHEVCDCG
jgi:hypothetical protein